MTHLNIADLVRRSRTLSKGMAQPQGGDARLREIAEFGANPGALRMLEFVPPGLPAGSPLVVVLHGCTQTAGGFDQHADWSALAAAHGFALLYPEQRPQNNAQRCFTWFEPGDTARGQGEAASIAAGIGHVLRTHGLDPKRVFITGLSAGGAMTSAMLAAYPELFAAGAIIGGLPAGAARSLPEAMEAMQTSRPRSPAAWAAAVRGASGHAGPWPRISIWHGEADAVVAPVNAEASVTQWRNVMGLEGAPLTLPGRTPADRHHGWRDAEGRVVLEQHSIAGMGHGVPVGEGSGTPGPFFLAVGIGSTAAIAGFFGVATGQPVRAASPGVIAVGGDGVARAAPRPAPAEQEHGPGAVIRRALAAAGLLRN